jgi:hypothetical protein
LGILNRSEPILIMSDLKDFSIATARMMPVIILADVSLPEEAYDEAIGVILKT